MKIELYDSYSRSLRVFESIEAGKVGLYACGPTVYNYAHIGNLRTYLFEDTLRRVLEMAGYEVRHVVNITDVGHLTSDADTGEDKVEKGARRAGKSAWDIAEQYTRAFQSDLKQLNIIAPVIWCRATDHIEEQLRDIATIEAKGFTYITSDGVYFDTAKLDNYGYIARLDIAGLNAGSRVASGEKRNATDFALWKFSGKDEKRQMEWQSPWGKGFPGWHIECSAMATKYLGAQFDIHCGGKDHIPVHHANEIAQSEVCHGTNLANYWLHGYFLETDKHKMSKSDGAFLRLQTLQQHGYEPLAYRYLCLTANYRSDLKFTWESLDSAAVGLNRLRNISHGLGAPTSINHDWLEKFQQQVARDLNTTKGLAIVWAMVKQALPAGECQATLLEIDNVLGLGLAGWKPAEISIPPAVTAMVAARNAARAARDWATADRLREQISTLGFEIEDSAGGAKIKPK